MMGGAHGSLRKAEAVVQARDAADARGIVVIGAGQAGGRAVEALRMQGFTGQLTLIGDEEAYPYERPSLSKEMLHAQAEETIAWIQKPEFYKARNIMLRRCTRAIAIDRARKNVQLASGEKVEYGVLIFATGARVRRLNIPGVTPLNCHYLRTLADSRALRARLVEGSRVVVIGAGFIGLEAAAAAVTAGCDVTVLELGGLPLGRVVPERIGQYYRDLHAAHGVKFVFGVKLARLQDHGDAVVVETAESDMIVADTLIVGIGVIPNDDLAAQAGLVVDRGIVVDEFGMTEDPAIFAAGDVARHFNPIYGRHILLESWHNAQSKAIAIAKSLAGAAAPAPSAELPWFWSDQYDINLQMFGLPDAEAQWVTRGDAAGKSWMLLQLKDGRMVCAIGMNVARELRAARDLIFIGARIPQDELTDTSVPLVDLLRRAKREATLA